MKMTGVNVRHEGHSLKITGLKVRPAGHSMIMSIGFCRANAGVILLLLATPPHFTLQKVGVIMPETDDEHTTIGSLSGPIH